MARAFNLKTHCISVLRRSFLRSALRQQVLVKWRKRMPLGRNGKEVYALPCKKCRKWVKQSEIKIDHIKPVIDQKKGWQGLDVFAERLFCSVNNLQPLCKGCHDAKTKRERKQRRKISSRNGGTSSGSKSRRTKKKARARRKHVA